MAGCDLLQGCSVFCCEPIKELIDSEVNAPYASVTVAGPAGTITVGNNSQPQRGNHAVIKSLKYGHGGGLGLEIEIADEAGGAFATFINSLVTVMDMSTIRFCNWITARWGWVETSCGDVDKVERFTEHTLNLLSVETQFTEQLIKFNLKGVDLSRVTFETATAETYGTDNNPIALKEAIRSICDKYECNVEFRKPGVDNVDAYEFKPNQLVKAAFKAQGEHFLQAILRWIRPYTTDGDLGVTPSFNSKRASGSRNVLILWEDFIPQCNKLNANCQSIGTYIVNGGSRSPVIDFKPNLKWTFGMINKSGGDSSPVNNQQLQEPGQSGCKTTGNQTDPEVGTPTFTVVTDDAVNVYGTQTALRQTQLAQAANTRANVAFNSIEAELKIQGDPLLADPVFLVGKPISIVVINPFHIQDLSGVGGSGCEWLQAETCNSVLSNRRWMIMGTSHEIKEGSYTTTIKVRLVAPGSEISLNEPLGGDTKGFVINNICRENIT